MQSPPKQFTYQAYPKNLTSISDVLLAMDKLQTELHDTDMQNLQAFNWTYRIITDAVIKKLDTGYFMDDLLMQQIDIRFAQYYFSALHDFIQGKSVAPAWEILFEKCKNNDLFQSAYMALGVNAHVNHDLAFTLLDVLDDKDAKRDYDAINAILSQQIMSVFTSFTEDSRTIDGTKNNLVFLYRPLLSKIIKKWRENAWKNFLLLSENALDQQIIARRAGKMATRLARFQKTSALLIGKKDV